MKSLIQKRFFSKFNINHFKVTILGSSGAIGQPLSLLLKLNPKIKKLSLYDINSPIGVSKDISHISTICKVNGYNDKNISEALDHSDIVVLCAGLSRKPGMTRADLFEINASIIKKLIGDVAKYSPKSTILIITNPINYIVPIAAHVLCSYDVYNPQKLFGVTQLDLMRASTFISEIVGSDPKNEHIPVVGGHSGQTIVPLISQTAHANLDPLVASSLIKRVQYGGDEIVQAKNGSGSASLSMAYATAFFTSNILDALSGEKVDLFSYVDSPLFRKENIDFFSSKITVGKNGIENYHNLGVLSESENKMLHICKDVLKKEIKSGMQFAKKNFIN